MSMVIRKPALRDRAGLEAALRSDGTFRADEIAVALELVDSALAQEGDYRLRIAEVERTAIAGYICFGPTPMTAGTYDLYWVVTHAQWRGRGIARALIAAMEAELSAAGATAIRVETSQTEGYGAARNLYVACDYPLAARFAEFYGPGDDLIVYYKRL
jgi:ribosomal protein S18 acetylase RimI-like enzyme